MKPRKCSKDGVFAVFSFVATNVLFLTTCIFCGISNICLSHFQDLVVRVCFVLGNITAKKDSARKLLYDQPRAMETLMALLKYYMELDLKVQAYMYIELLRF